MKKLIILLIPIVLVACGKVQPSTENINPVSDIPSPAPVIQEGKEKENVPEKPSQSPSPKPQNTPKNVELEKKTDDLAKELDGIVDELMK